MKNHIYYFTGTGNSLVLAKHLAKELGDTEVFSIPKMINKTLDASAETIGLVFPVYIWGLPLIVERFIDKLSTLNGIKTKYIFAVSNHGGMPAATLLQAKKSLQKHGLILAAGYSLRMPGNYTPLYGAIAVSKQEQQFAKAEAKIKKIVQVIKNKRLDKIEANNFLVNAFFSGFIYNASAKYIPKMAKDFWVDDKCDHCGICAKVCQVQNIKMENGLPKWLDHCEQCLACLQWCPREAIQYGKSTANKKRYHHPEVTVKDMF